MNEYTFLFHPLGIAACLITFLAAITMAAAAEDGADDKRLRPERWREYSHGLSLRPPLHGELSTTNIGDDALLRIDGNRRYVMKFYIKKSAMPLTLKELTSDAVAKISWVQPSVRYLEEQSHGVEIGGRAGSITYMIIPEKEKGAWYLGQAFLQINSTTFALLRLEVNKRFFESARPVFEDVFHSIMVEDIALLNQKRDHLLQRGKAWQETILTSALLEALPANQWYRIIEQDKDIGYMHVQTQAASKMEMPGLLIDSKVRIIVGDRAQDSVSNFFCSNDNSTEVWSVKTTIRPLTDEARLSSATEDGSQSWAETGLRANQSVDLDGGHKVLNVITVSRESPSGRHKSQWQRPPVGYLSQVMIYGIGPLLPHDEPGEMGFYAYSANAGNIVFRTERMEPADDGTYKVYSRPVPQDQEQVTEYDVDGTFLRRILPNGRIVEPASAQRIKTLWKVRGQR